jgi:hypothetical protein
MQDDLAKSDEKRKLRRIRSLWDLVNSTVQTSVGTGREAKTVAFPSPLSDPAAQSELLPILLDKCTTSNRTDLRPRVNAMTAPRTVLAAIQLASGVPEGDIEAILSNRPAPGDAGDLRYRTAAWLVTDARLPIDTVKKLDAYLTGRTQVYRVQSLGYHEKGGPTARVEAVIDTNLGRPRIVYWRDLSELGRGFEVPRGAP